MGNFLFIWIEERHLCSLWYLKRQDSSSLLTSFFTPLYLTLLPWRLPHSEFPHASLFLFCTFNILSFIRIFSNLCALWSPILFSRPSSWKADNLFFLFKYLCLVLESHHQSQLHSDYTPILLFSISGFHFNPSDAPVCHVPYCPVKLPLSSSSALPPQCHPSTSVSLSSRTLNFFLSSLWEVPSFSFCFLVPLLLPQWDFPACNLLLRVVFHIRSASSWQHLTGHISHPSACFSFSTARRCFISAVCRCLSYSLGLPGAVMYHGEWGAVSVCWHLSVPQQLSTLPPRPGCSHSMLWWENYSSWVRVKVFAVKYQSVEGKIMTHIHR